MDKETPYSNRELREFFDAIGGKLDTVVAQTTKTNGRVSALENWRWFITGGLVVIGMMIVPIFLSMVGK